MSPRTLEPLCRYHPLFFLLPTFLKEATFRVEQLLALRGHVPNKLPDKGGKQVSGSARQANFELVSRLRLFSGNWCSWFPILLSISDQIVLDSAWKTLGRRRHFLQNPWRTRIYKESEILCIIFFQIRVFQGILRKASTSSKRLPSFSQDHNTHIVKTIVFSWKTPGRHGHLSQNALEDTDLERK